MWRRVQTPSRRFIRVRLLARCADAHVWAAWDRRDQQWVALKVSSPTADAATRSLLSREGAIRLPHPYVAAATDVVQHREMPTLVMDLARGGTLRDLARREGRLPAAYVAVVAEQLLDALVAVHAVGLVHRDIKPANLLLEATGRGRPHVRLADFGVAARVGAPWDAAGTPGYVAPEVQRGADPHPAQDIWAAGVLIRQLHDQPGPLSTLTVAMSHPDPARRPSAAHALQRLRALPRPRAERWPEVPDLFQSPLRSKTRPAPVPGPAKFHREPTMLE